jgi:hypothetical protein
MKRPPNPFTTPGSNVCTATDPTGAAALGEPVAAACGDAPEEGVGEAGDQGRVHGESTFPVNPCSCTGPASVWRAFSAAAFCRPNATTAAFCASERTPGTNAGAFTDAVALGAASDRPSGAARPATTGATAVAAATRTGKPPARANDPPTPTAADPGRGGVTTTADGVLGEAFDLPEPPALTGAGPGTGFSAGAPGNPGPDDVAGPSAAAGSTLRPAHTRLAPTSSPNPRLSRPGDPCPPNTHDEPGPNTRRPTEQPPPNRPRGGTPTRAPRSTAIPQHQAPRTQAGECAEKPRPAERST